MMPLLEIRKKQKKDTERLKNFQKVTQHVNGRVRVQMQSGH